MSPSLSSRGRHRTAARRGLTLVELLVATAIMVVLAGALAALAETFYQSSRYSQGQTDAAQHARVVLGRIERSLCAAHASEDFPGFAVFSRRVGAWEFPETLAVWRPDGQPANPDGLPLWSELVVFCPDERDPSRLVELTVPSDRRPVPPLSDWSAWRNELRALKSSDKTARVQLTDLLRTATVGNRLRGQVLGAVRFNVVHRPSQQDWESYRNGTLAWEELPWVQDVSGPSTGLRQSWCCFEIQLLPRRDIREQDAARERAIPFLGSGALYYELHR